MIEGIGSTVRYMGTNWINRMYSVPPVWGVNRNTKAASYSQRTEEKKTFQQLLEEAMKGDLKIPEE